MNSADGKTVKLHEFTAKAFTEEGEHILCAVILGPDRDDGTQCALHFRTHADAIEILRSLPSDTRRMIVEHQEKLLSDFRKLLLP